jgi:hypothetical protein
VFHIVTGVIDVIYDCLEHRVSLVWVEDSYWRTISTTHLGVPGRLMGGGVWLPGRDCFLLCIVSRASIILQAGPLTSKFDITRRGEVRIVGTRTCQRSI